MQADFGPLRIDAAALRRSQFTLHQPAIFRYTCMRPFLDKPHLVRIGHAPLDELNQPVHSTFRSVMQNNGGSPGYRARCARACPGSVTARGPTLPRRSGRTGLASGERLPLRHLRTADVRATGHGLRGSIFGPCISLSTLRPYSYERIRLTRGRRSGQSLRHRSLSFTLSCRL